MIITEDMLYKLLVSLNERLKEDYIKSSLNTRIVSEVMQIKKIRVYSNKEKLWITVNTEN